MESGIAVIVNKTNNKGFVFYSKNIEKRVNYYKKRLAIGKFRNDKLQEDWNKIGKDNFDFIILEKHEYNPSIYNRYKEYLKYYSINYNSDRNKPKKSTIAGIVAIENKLNNKRFYFYSKDVNRQINRYKKSLNKNSFRNDKLQDDWNSIGENNFEFIIIEKCDNNSSLSALNREYIEKYPNNYNVERNKSKKSGIAAIVNKTNNKKFYTFATDLDKQKQRLMKKLEKNTLKNKGLQEDWNKLNETDFEFLIVELKKGTYDTLKKLRDKYVEDDLNSYNNQEFI